jgi:hypothetical protein
MWLPWKAALALAIALAIVPLLAVFGLLARPRGRVTVFVYSLARETAVVLGLYALWQYAGTLALLKVDGAIARGRWIAHLELAATPGPRLVAVHAGVERVLRHRALPGDDRVPHLDVHPPSRRLPAGS